MASVQQAHQGVAQINHDKEKAILGELLKEAQAAVEISIEPSQLHFATVAGHVKNSQFDRLKLAKVHNRFGHFVKYPSEDIVQGGPPGSFTHNAEPRAILPAIIGSKAAVIYGTAGFGVPRTGYLLAWYKAQNSDEHKVYVQAGELSKLEKLEWAEIEQKLDASGSESYYADTQTRAFATAKIINLTIPHLATLGANFGTFIPA